MNKTMNAILKNYGTENVISRLMEQLRILADSNDEEVTFTVKKLLSDLPCDTEYIYNLCEFTNLVTYTSDKAAINDVPWKEEYIRERLING